MYSNIFVFLFIMYMSMLQPVMSHETYNSPLSLFSAHSMDILVWSSYRNTQTPTVQALLALLLLQQQSKVMSALQNDDCTPFLVLLLYSFYVVNNSRSGRYI